MPQKFLQSFLPKTRDLPGEFLGIEPSGLGESGLEGLSLEPA